MKTIKTMTKAERYFLLLENFILHVTHCSDESEPAFNEVMHFTPNILYQSAKDYIEEDHVDGKGNEDNLKQDLSLELIKKLAKSLIGDGENKEYTRGICELIADIDGKEEMPHAERSQEIADEMGLNINLYE